MILYILGTERNDSLLRKICYSSVHKWQGHMMNEAWDLNNIWPASFKKNVGVLQFWLIASLQDDIEAASVVPRKKNSLNWGRERTIPTERPPLVGEVIANFCG
jgi:hypothetical protein